MRISSQSQITFRIIGDPMRQFAGSNRRLDHVAHAWEMVDILERNDVLVWQIKARDVGVIYYQDDAQVFARPTRAVRRLLRRQ
jgi:hypothetical protein